MGDSLGMAVLGYDSTLPVTLEEIMHHTRAVRRGTKRALLVADMPYGSFHVSIEESVRNAVRLVKEGGAEAVKVEGGERRIELIARLVEAEIPVMGHVGLTPQSVNALGGFPCRAKQPTRRGKSSATRERWKPREPFPSCSNRCRANWPRASRRSCAFRPSASAPAPIATARSSCSTIWLASPRAQTEIRAAVRQFFSGDFARRIGVLRGCAQRSFPSDAESYHSAAELREHLPAPQRR